MPQMFSELHRPHKDSAEQVCHARPPIAHTVHGPSSAHSASNLCEPVCISCAHPAAFAAQPHLANTMRSTFASSSTCTAQNTTHRFSVCLKLHHGRQRQCAHHNICAWQSMLLFYGAVQRCWCACLTHLLLLACCTKPTETQYATVSLHKAHPKHQGPLPFQ